MEIASQSFTPCNGLVVGFFLFFQKTFLDVALIFEVDLSPDLFADGIDLLVSCWISVQTGMTLISTESDVYKEEVKTVWSGPVKTVRTLRPT